jgi:hypothetical protein
MTRSLTSALDPTPLQPLLDEKVPFTELRGFRNKLINGNFDHWQRGTSLAAASSTRYLADRWATSATGTTITASQQSFSVGQLDVPGGPSFFHRSVVSSVSGTTNAALLFQAIENVQNFSDKTITLSFWAKADATKNISIEFRQSFGTGGSPSAVENAIGVTKVSVGTTWQHIILTAQLPSISGKTLGTAANTSSLQVFFWFDAGSGLNSRTDSLGHQSGTFDIAQVQVEEGPVATPFEQRPIGLELALCQRYYFKGTANQFQTFWSGRAVSSGTYYGLGSFPVEMRVTPTVTLTNSSVVGFPTTPTFNSASRTHVLEQRTCNTTTDVGYFGSSITADAEL